ncbi:MAG: hypothetical protein QM519_00350 [Bacteroidia bacterium]|nr:hypothetical protein [Bacteroidia bacterium]
MAKAYTPGLTVSSRVRYRARRLLPLTGRITVKVGDLVAATDVVAQTDLEGDITPMKMSNLLSCAPRDVPSLLLKPVGSAIAKDEPIAQSKGIFGMMKVTVKATASGTIESASDSTGMVMIRGAAQPVQVRAFTSGRVIEVLGSEGAVVENDVALVQGIFGIGGEAYGPIAIACARPGERLEASSIRGEHAGCILVGGARMSIDAIRRAIELGVAAIVSGGIDDADLKALLGHDLGVAITGSEKVGITLVVTEGFGDIAMAARTHALLVSHAGHAASVNGATQIRAGVMRPEIVIPLADEATGDAHAGGGATAGELSIGTSVRVIRDPWFGALGTVAALPEQPAVLGSGSKARVLEVALADGQRVVVPRANVELIAE